MKGEYSISAPKRNVWKALNDPEILMKCIPGCDQIEKQSDTSFVAKVTAKVGPVKAKFSGEVTLSDLEPPNSYKISGEGKGGAAGFAKGGAKVILIENPDGGTILSYTVTAQVGGKLAQIGSRLIDATAKKFAGDFFKIFRQIVEEGSGQIDDLNNNSQTGIPLTKPDVGGQVMSDDKQVEENVYPKTHWSVWITGGISVLVLLAFISNL